MNKLGSSVLDSIMYFLLPYMYFSGTRAGFLSGFSSRGGKRDDFRIKRGHELYYCHLQMG